MPKATPGLDLLAALWAFTPQEEKRRITRAIASYAESLAAEKRLQVARLEAEAQTIGQE